LLVRPHVTRAKIRAPSPVLAVVLLAILVMASAVLGWLGGLVAWLIVLGALAVFAFCLRGRPWPWPLCTRNKPRSWLHVYDTGSGDGTTGLAVFWQHGTPSTGAPPEPLFAAAAERGIRWVSHDRPGYGGSTPHPGRDVASAAAEAYFASAEFDPEVFTPADHAAAFGAWSWLGTVAAQALATD
jgi:hypothetical protein